ncbi:MAG: methionyl-tRNA formyltransferase [Rhodobiaceae bacterium]|nr:methionyl-tRNA formyltransferase [Rhodobiaceae bacterium]MCC0013910.1 methionyl-tRNA formyltransferase [Rhodobiaceae bacterium]MCC0017869.1 methionyl-tRNA formyltransferase [Rhodobiaceae bacterium]MCC0062426.1 methionyl-tRNA formyltransferase [Rhodobiaceae bacterium]
MALIRKFTKKTMDRNQVHGEITATYSVFHWDDRTLLQIDSYGSKARKIPGKKSQTFQLDEQGASALFQILKKEFGFS